MPLKRFLLILVLGQIMAKEFACEQFSFLDDLVEKVDAEETLNSLLVIQHHQNKNCSLQDWNPLRFPIIRVSELVNMKIRGVFNSKTMALVCIRGYSDLELLDRVAMIFKDMRYERIILWIRYRPTRKFFKQIIKKANQFKFIRVLVLQVGDHEIISSHYLNLFPSAQFKRINNILTARKIFDFSSDFRGATALVRDPTEMNPFKTKSTPTGIKPFFQIDVMQMEEFARRHNLKLKYLEGNGTQNEPFDMELRLKLIGKNNLSSNLGFVNPSSSSSLIVIVPCGEGKSLIDIYKQMDIKKWFAYVLVLYVILILVENFVLLVTCRINAQSYRLRRENFLLNLCAFRALLGMSFPISRRASLSQRQLFLAMSVFGIVFSNFFSCKLSALFTTHPIRPRVTNFDELRASGLVVTVDPLTRGFIENELDAEFFHWVLPRTVVMNNMERSRLLLSFNTTYAHIIYQETWRYISSFQHNMDRQAFCTSKDLTIVENLPRAFVLQQDSLFLWPLTKFLTLIQEAGITIHWAKGTFHATKKFLNITYPESFWSQAVPIQVEHLTWLGYLLCLGYGLATIVFIIERFYGARRNMN